MSYVRIYVHAVFCTKKRYPFLNKEIRRDVFQHIKKNTEEKGIWLDSINGIEDHVHCLIALRRDQCISDVMQLIKGESSNWINRMELTESKFSWQDDYWAVGVGDERLKNIRQYIFNQEKHHGRISFDQEIEKYFPDEDSV